jgi:hypothetical protein
MAWKFPQEYVRDGDVVEPSEWRKNLQEILSEYNGYLDRDNIRESSLGKSSFKRGTFTQVQSSNASSETRTFLFTMDQSGWIKKTTRLNDTQEPNDLPRSASTNVYYARPDVKPMANYMEADLPRITLKPETSGLLIAEFSGTVDWCQKTSRNTFTSGGYVYASNSEEYAYYAPQDKKFKQLSAFILCSMWRLTVDGQTIAETGPIGNEYLSHPIYLCGATPVTNRNEIVVQLEARFVWYSPGTNSFKSASGYSPYARNKGGTQQVYARQDCMLSCPNLIATFRKR